eukprot:362096_1
MDTFLDEVMNQDLDQQALTAYSETTKYDLKALVENGFPDEDDKKILDFDELVDARSNFRLSENMVFDMKMAEKVSAARAPDAKGNGHGNGVNVKPFFDYYLDGIPTPNSVLLQTVTPSPDTVVDECEYSPPIESL